MIFALFRRTCHSVHKNGRISSPIYMFARNADVIQLIGSDMMVHEDFISEDEEATLLADVASELKRTRYETAHWDNAIEAYKEIEKSRWKKEAQNIISKTKQFAFPANYRTLSQVHVLDLAKEGVIKPHIDSVKFCGDIIAGLSLVSTSVMRLVHEEDKNLSVDILLKNRSLYIMKGLARYKFTHEILSDQDSKFDKLIVPRDRRISIIFRCEVNTVAAETQ
ncbi:Alpha-ketoglutarate-dependent dioxygenase alkB -like protein 7, mitochondrial [Halotydeus destructor]|nr:Alpha-ketoglutarate-dependent dioxygenase alkB -like protein 7, mitochondrial [Halotydeus destructor]